MFKSLDLVGRGQKVMINECVEALADGLEMYLIYKYLFSVRSTKTLQRTSVSADIFVLVVYDWSRPRNTL